ncbi:manganese peroxidase 2 [Phellopilus nigrolimitatus]|nr:manganese peroxidase 2 [Phellopilus nigrolimitatus]
MVFKLAAATVALAAFASAANYRRVACPDGVNTASNAACCSFFALRDDLMTNLFNGTCGEDAHEALRLTFHDAIGFSQNGTFKGAGADGSMMIFSDIETNFAANAGIDDSVDALAPFLTRHNVTAGDLIQFAGALGITNCPGAPRLTFLAGLPLPQSPIDFILSRMEDGGITDLETVHLLASHSIARSDTLVPATKQFRSTQRQFTFDPQIFLEVDSPLPASNEMRLQSDFAIARDSRTACEWQVYGWLPWPNLLSSVHDPNTLIDCSELIPIPVQPVGSAAVFPAGTGPEDVEQACAATAFPTLQAASGEATVIPECPDGDINLADCPS